MAERYSDNDGSDIFWPGYVDAVTNLVLNLLFLLTIMTVAVFMFALELGRASKGGPETLPATATKKDADIISKAKMDTVKETLAKENIAKDNFAKENIALKHEIELLKMKLAQQKALPSVSKPVQQAGLAKTVDVTSTVPKPLISVDKTVAASESDILVRFTDDAVTFTPAEHDRLREVLKNIVANGKTSIFVEVPAGFTEAKRMGFYRAMAVRNLLIEMKMPKDAIDVSVVERKKNGNASLVRVKSR
jgi:outer membrane protein OmpA-like peptidoglycan-associated protein